MNASAARVAVDIGGTFTDVVLLQGARQFSAKVLTTYADPADAVMEGLERVTSAAAIAPGSIALVLHGTTLATNALIERRGAVTALLTTAGHRDALEMALENRFDQYDLAIDRPPPLVPRTLRLTVPERLDATGAVRVPLDEAAILNLIPMLRAARVESLAIGFLHAYANPVHERRAAELLGRACPTLSLSLSSEVCPEIREYERLSTTCANAYVKPQMARYLASLETQLRRAGYGAPLLLMTSAGGLTDLATARAFPIRLVESGPAGGAVLASHLARRYALDRVLSFDMGGTTAKICLIDDGTPLVSRAFEVGRVYRFRKGSGLPVRIPVIEMVEIGAGGGSIARVDRLRRLQVGPDSAGSEPGPACYGRGGWAPTVTDADLVLGHLSAEWFAGGTLVPDPVAAATAIASAVAEPMGVGVVEGASAILSVVEENMAAAARAHAAEWGSELASRTLIAFGGAGPLHAAALADSLNIDRLVIPAHAGVGSALGFLLAPVRFDVVRTRYQRLQTLDVDAVHDVFVDMWAEAAAVQRLAAPDSSTWRVQRRAAMRYVGQGHELGIELPSDLFSSAPTPDLRGRWQAVLRSAFERDYERLYGRQIPMLDVEILSFTLSLTAEAETSVAAVASMRVSAANQSSVASGQQPSSTAALLWRDALPVDTLIPGPVLVADGQTTVVVPAGFSARADQDGHLWLERPGAGGNALES
jgi:N-methylhydantoinase A